MKQTIFICDICERETDPDEMLHTESGKDVCAECLATLVDNYFDRKAEKVKEEPAEVEEVPKEIKEKPEENKKAKKEIKEAPEQKFDAGKAQALRNAGWGVKQIAEEMGCCVATVYNNTHPAAEKKAKPLEWVGDDIKRQGNTDTAYIKEAMK